MFGLGYWDKIAFLGVMGPGFDFANYQWEASVY